MALAAACFAVAASPAAAHGATVGYEGETLRYAGEDEANDVSIFPVPGGWEFRERAGVVVVPGVGCAVANTLGGGPSGTEVVCAALSDDVTVAVSTGAGDDRIFPTRYQFHQEDPNAAAYVLDGGPGSDVIWGSSEGVPTAGDGGEGDDFVFGSSAGDVARGGPGADWLITGPGPDHLDGGDGDDLLNGQGEDDTLSAGPGADDVRGGAGDDRIRSRDGAADAVDCGAGEDDWALADPLDALAGCERDWLRGGPEKAFPT